MGDQDYWLATTGVEDIENVMEDIEKNGGQEVVQKNVDPTIGYSAFFKDPDG